VDFKKNRFSEAIGLSQLLPHFYLRKPWVC